MSSILGRCLAFGLCFVAALLFALQDQSLTPFFFIPVVALIATFVAGWVPSRRLEADVFCMAFGLYALLAAITQTVNAEFYGVMFGTIDSGTFYRAAQGYLGRVPLTFIYVVEGRGGLDTTLTAFVYQHVLDFVQIFEKHPVVWPLLCTNAVVGALGLALTVALARIVFLEKQAPIFATIFFAMFCPQLAYYTVELLRDGFVYLIVTWMFLSVAALMRSKSIRQMIGASASLLIATALISVARTQFVLLGIVAASLIPVTGFIYGRRTHTKALLIIAAVVAIGLAVVVALPILTEVAGSANVFNSIYGKNAQAEGGLGYTLIVSLPAPLRLIAGSVYQHLFPIPLWADFGGPTPAWWLISLNGIWIALLVPLAVVGAGMLFSSYSSAVLDRRLLTLMALLYGFLIAIVAVTTLETRHTSAGYSAFFLLAAAPFADTERTWPALRFYSQLWLAAVVVVHLVWATLKAV